MWGKSSTWETSSKKNGINDHRGGTDYSRKREMKLNGNNPTKTLNKEMCYLMREMGSEKCIASLFCHGANIIENTRNLGGIAWHTPSLYGRAYSCVRENSIISSTLLGSWLRYTCNKRQINRNHRQKFNNMYTSCILGRDLGKRGWRHCLKQHLQMKMRDAVEESVMEDEEEQLRTQR